MTNDFEYEETGRRPIIWFSLCVFLFLFWLAYTEGAPWWIWAVWSISGGMVVYMLIANPKSGMRITGSTLAYWAGGPRSTLTLSDIDHIVIEDWSEATDVTIELTDGRSIELFSGSLPPIHVLEKQLQARNIAVLRK